MTNERETWEKVESDDEYWGKCWDIKGRSSASIMVRTDDIIARVYQEDDAEQIIADHDRSLGHGSEQIVVDTSKLKGIPASTASPTSSDVGSEQERAGPALVEAIEAMGRRLHEIDHGEGMPPFELCTELACETRWTLIGFVHPNRHEEALYHWRLRHPNHVPAGWKP